MFEFLKKGKKKGAFGNLDQLWMSGLAITIFGVVLVIGVRIFIGFNTTFDVNGTPLVECYGANQSGACTTVLQNMSAGLVNLSSWTSLITTVIAGVVILGLVMMVAYLAAPRGGGGTA